MPAPNTGSRLLLSASAVLLRSISMSYQRMPAREYLDGTERQRAYDARREPFRLRREDVQRISCIT